MQGELFLITGEAGPGWIGQFRSGVPAIALTRPLACIEMSAPPEQFDPQRL